MPVYHYELESDDPRLTGSGTYIDKDAATIEQAWLRLVDKYGERLLSVCTKPNYSKCLKRGVADVIQQNAEISQ